jgi:hypothetical protein
MDLSKIKMIAQHVSLVLTGGALLLGSSMVLAANSGSYTLKGTCAFLPADRATEFHGNPGRSKLNLGMAGNQWVVFDNVMRAFNLAIGKGDGSEPAYRPNDGAGFTLADLNDNANRYFVELIPPGQIRKQIKSGCMTVGNDEERNFLPGNYQVDFDVFASTNYDLMQDLANNGFIDEAVPYIRNRLDLMVAEGNPQGIGSTNYTGDAAFDTQFDIIMDLLSGDVVASSLDHINEGIHNAANGYMKKAHGYIRNPANDRLVNMAYTYADGTSETAEKMASAWVQDALAVVATPMAGSPSEARLANRDAGENHASSGGHDLDTVADSTGALLCKYNATDYKFCEFAILNKANTHESRVHHVETPNGVLRDDPATPVVEENAPDNGYVPVDVGFVWITELAYQVNAGNTAVTGMNGTALATLGIPNTGGVNGDKIYSLALLATSNNEKRGHQFIDFLRSPEGQMAYTDGGFTGLLDQADFDKGVCYAMPVAGVSAATPRNGAGSCPDWLGNGSF